MTSADGERSIAAACRRGRRAHPLPAPRRWPGGRRRGPGRLAAAVASGAVLVSGLTACGGGGGGPALATTIATRDNAICKTYAGRIEGIKTPPFDPGQATSARLPAVARYLDQVTPLLQSEQREISSAGRPTTSGSLYDSMLTALAAVIRDEQNARAAAHVGDMHAYRDAFRTDQADSTHLSGVAQQFGAAACVTG